MRRNLDIPKEVSIVRDIASKEIKVYTDSGRVQRPLLIVEENRLRIKRYHVSRMLSKESEEHVGFDDTLKLGLIEFIDVEEEETTMIAMNIRDL
mmetsp:Transcript_18870/g.8796  ORF Transcript_18870/g.8796 Transcript_18870/m.8796 type:complete len:94 (-) Transcript_18870:236-517(-)